ncbi:ATP-binding cassette domain-containing protein, partial [Streptomyces sp. URMC 123]|uniref:ATP-binding cassette domain-containing protein n=1 Tax=Streptomyces sp. URMC 123 TaxID=3423403 RepID=UPI003F1D79D9
MDSTPHGAAVTAVGLGLKGPRGWAFQDIGFHAEPGSLIAVEGTSGTGRTCLLLALTGRMRATAGHAEVAGHRLPKQMSAVRQLSSLGPVPGVADLDPALTVAEHLRERALLESRFGDSLRALLRPRSERKAEKRRRIEAALEGAGLDLDTLPKGPRTSVRDLERLEVLRLSVALALIGRPRLLGVDDLDLKLSDAEREQAWELLRDVARTGTTVLAVCSEAPKDALVVSTGASRSKAEVAKAEAKRVKAEAGKAKPKPKATETGEATAKDASPKAKTSAKADLTKAPAAPEATPKATETGEATAKDEAPAKDEALAK